MKRFRSIVAVLVALVLALGAMLPPAAAATDLVVPLQTECGLPSHWSATYACDLKVHGIMQGDGVSFRLDGTLTRAEWVTLLVRALGYAPEAGPSYSDVEGHWSAGYIKAAKSKGIVMAADGLFRPDESITREEALSLWAWGVAGSQLSSVDLRVLNGYKDAADIAEYAKPGVAFSLLTGIVLGRPDGALAPKGKLTRGEAAKLISIGVPELLPAGQDKLSLVLYNDLHGHLIQDSRQRPKNDVGVARLTTAIAGQLLKNPNTIVIDGGDTFQGTPISNLVAGQSTQEWRSTLGVEVATIGNHEFDWSVGTLKKLIDSASHPTVSANIFLEGTETRPEWAVPSTIHTEGGYKIGIIGITTPVTKSIVVAEYVEGLEFRDPAPVVNQEAKKLREAGVDLVLVVSHTSASPGKANPFQVENEVAEWMKRVTEPIDAVTGAHSHEQAAGYVLNANGLQVPVIQAGSYGRALARVDLYIDRATGKVVKAVPVVWEPDQRLAATPWATDLLAKWTAEVKPIESRPVGKAVETISRKVTPAGESALGDFIADAMLTAAPGIQIAVMNGGGIRADLEVDQATGSVTWGALYTVQPFGNTLVTVDMTGAQLKTFLEQGVDSYVKNVLSQPGGHQPIQVSGITFVWDFAKPKGERVDPAQLKLADGSLVDMNATYKVVVNSFMAGGGDDLAILKELKDKQVDLGVIDLDVAVEYFKKQTAEKPLSYSLQNRIQVLNFPTTAQ